LFVCRFSLVATLCLFAVAPAPPPSAAATAPPAPPGRPVRVELLRGIAVRRATVGLVVAFLPVRLVFRIVGRLRSVGRHRCPRFVASRFSRRLAPVLATATAPPATPPTSATFLAAP